MTDSSLEYWNKRWAQAPMAYNSSWPDFCARQLELAYLEKHLPEKGSIVEVGCGNFSLAESPQLLDMLCGRYVGVDGSKVAVNAALERAGPGYEFFVSDLTVECPPAGDFLLSRRTIQNLSPAGRVLLLAHLKQYAHGLLLEDYACAREFTDFDRRRMGRPPLEVPPYNWPLTYAELYKALPRPVQAVDPFMGWFYAITRVFPDLSPEAHRSAADLSMRAIQSGAEQPYRGPVVAIAW